MTVDLSIRDARLALECAETISQAYVAGLDVKTTQSAISPTSFIIALRGTSNVDDWMTNVRRELVRFGDSGERAHAGFADRHDELFPSVCVYGTEQYKRGGEVILTGHSLGGAVATLLAYTMRRHCKVPIRLITFGSPRAGNAKLAAEIGASMRFITDRDPVPLVPYFSYQHVPGRIIVNNDGSVTGGLGHGISRILHWLRFKKSDLADHGIGRYATNLIAFINKELGPHA